MIRATGASGREPRGLAWNALATSEPTCATKKLAGEGLVSPKNFKDFFVSFVRLLAKNSFTKGASETEKANR